MNILVTEHKIRGAKINGNKDPTADGKNNPFRVPGLRKINDFIIRPIVNSDRFGQSSPPINPILR